MSYSALMSVGDNYPEDCQTIAEFRNSWKLGMFVWSWLSEKYYGKPATLLDMQPVWDLATGGEINGSDWLVLVSTFDSAVCKAEAVPLLAKAYEKVAAEVEEQKPGTVWHGEAIAKALREYHEENPEGEIVFMVNSISGLPEQEPFRYP